MAYLPWLLALEKSSPRKAFLQSYLIGILFFAGTIWWVGYVTIPGTVLLIGYLALYFGIWGWLAQRMVSGLRRTPHTVHRTPLLTLPAAWVLLEYLRNTWLTGFGWNLIAHTQWNWIPVIQIADLTGVYGVSFLVVLVNVALWLAYSVQRTAYRKGLSAIALAGACLLAALAYGSFRIHQLEVYSRPTTHDPRLSFRVAVVQGNIPQTEKWDEVFQEEIWHRYETLTGQAAQSRPDLIVWPETAVPGYLEDPEIFERLQKLAQATDTPLLVGAPVTETVSGTERMFNSACLLNPQGNLVERYDKVHLVPFGEYLPLEFFFGWLRRFVLMGNFSPGSRFTVFQPATFRQPFTEDSRLKTHDVLPFSVLICFEDLFPDLSRRFVREGARWLLVITNDAWFHRSAASLQHLQACVFRAIENRVWVVRAANTGWSGFIDPAGRRISSVPRFESGVDSLSLHRGRP